MDRELTAEPFGGLVEAYGAKQIRMHVDFELGSVVELDLVLFDDRAGGIECAQIAAATRIAFDREARVDDRPVRTQLVADFAQVVISCAVEGGIEAVVAIETIGIGEVIALRHHHGAHAGAGRVAGMDAFAPSAEMFSETAGVRGGEPDRDGHFGGD